MKKFLMILIVLALSVSAAAAEGAGSPFVGALEETVRSFSTEENGFRAEVSAGGQAFSADIQYDGESGIAEIDLGQYGLIQADAGKTVYLSGGIPFVLNYSAWPGLAEIISDPGSIGRRAEAVLAGLAMKVKEYLVDPFVTYESKGSTFTLHMDYDTRELRKQLVPFLADLLADKTVRAFYPAAVRAARMAGLYIPDNPDRLPEYIASMIPDSESGWLRLTGDLQVSNMNGRNPEIAFSGCLHYGSPYDGGTYPLYFRLSLEDGKPSVTLEADMPFGGASFRMEGYRFRLATRRWRGGTPTFSMDGTYDPATGEISAAIRDSDGSQTGEVTGILLRDTLDLNIRYQRESLRISAKLGKRHVYAKVSVGGGSFGRNWELYFGEGPDQAASFRLSGYNPASRTEDACELLIGRYGLTAQYFSGGRQVLDASAEMNPKTGEIRVLGEVRDVWNRPYRISLSGAGAEYAASFSYPYYDWLVEGSGTIRFEPERLLKAAVFDVTVTGKSGYTEVTQYALERSEDTAERMVYRVRKDAETLWQLEAELRDEGAGRGIAVRLLQGSAPVFSVSVMPLEKQAVVPIDISNGVFLTPELVSTMLQTFIR